jgi:three-Cys-motif partner protein
MPAETAIEWTESTWNPVTGCSKVSPGCAHCYAETFAERWRGVRGNAYEQGFDLKLWPQRLDYPLKWKRPRVIFVNSMSDIFHEDIPVDYVERIFEVMNEAKHHTFQVLTKRHERMAELAPRLDWPPNVWMGVSIENKRWVCRADHLRHVPAAVRFISAEPLLGPLTGLDLTDIHWLIAGGESGPRHRPADAEWFRELREQCLQSGVAFFFKQWGGPRAKSGGRLLDGREWNEMPQVTYAANGNRTNGYRKKMPRSRDLPDSHPDKWVYTEHTRAKHEILRRYLGAWFSILGQSPGTDRLVIMDGFAGKGQYRDGEPGSPKIIFDRAVEVVEAGHAKEVFIGCVEKDKTNYDELAELCSTLNHGAVKIEARHTTFAEAAADLAEWGAKRRKPTPIFVTADPYGFRGVPLKVVKSLLALKRTEVLVTFMARDMSRFLNEENVEAPMKEFFGGDSWKSCGHLDLTHRPPCLLLNYQNVVRPTIAQYVIPFRVYEDTRHTMLYYLVHLTNNDLGMRKMKQAMVKESKDMTFWPVTVRPPDQLALEVDEGKPFPLLQKHLLEKYAGQSMTFLELMNDDYPDGVWLEPAYRAAVGAMENPEQGKPTVTVRRASLTAGGKPRTRGIKEEDTLRFI